MKYFYNFGIHKFFKDVLPESGYAFLESTIRSITTIKRSGLLSIGFLLAFFKFVTRKARNNIQ